MISIDGSIIIQIVNFIFLIWILNIILYKPIRNVLLQRKERVADFEQSIEASRRDVEEKDEAFSLGIKEAKAKGLKEKEGLLQIASEEERKIIEKINEKAQADIANVRAKIAKDAESVRKSLQQEVDTFADAIAQKILGRAV
ncbi:MAG: ATP synthase F0 subunit B [Desulfobacterales bacterium]